jgi:uncharacterized protein YcsI (UPF0317 family)
MPLGVPPSDFRKDVRSGAHGGNTSGFCPGYVQGNVVILPSEWAGDFLQFCQLNPKPCPLIGLSEKGNPLLPDLGRDLDIRTDLPRYRIFKDGTLVDEVTEIKDFWSDDFVTFVLGCSFSFEEALSADGLAVRNVIEGVNVPMYRTNIPCRAAGRFSGDMVVSMRPFLAADAIRAIQISTRFPSVHGAPIHLGDPLLIGIEDIHCPDFGDKVTIANDEIPVFWACGVTPQVALERAKPPLCITHSPGCMLVTDLPNSRLAIL